MQSLAPRDNRQDATNAKTRHDGRTGRGTAKDAKSAKFKEENVKPDKTMPISRAANDSIPSKEGVKLHSAINPVSLFFLALVAAWRFPSVA
ncbi:hypothetical protein Pla175_32690 [Pirellulimonas nuda]|uniref:Uncharacterized protein n=1 Tax=Pirellulimonas nuda TaxID=2528009 RepID=A0A518DEH6_9BACT|nr:hypothetical protein Pla175_32690 [Pirellulimonas nuda]